MYEDEKFKLSPPSIDDKHIWTKQEVELLLDLYEEYRGRLQDPRVRKTKVWEDIAKRIQEELESEVNGCQCNQKFRNMKADYQKVVEHNTRSGSFRKTCKYYERLEKLLATTSDDKQKDADSETESPFYSPSDGKPNLPNGKFYEREISHSSTSPEERDVAPIYDSSGSATLSPIGKRSREATESSEDDPCSNVRKRKFSECRDSSDDGRNDFYAIVQDFLAEQKRREEELFSKMQSLHKERIESVIKFLDMFKELLKKL